MVMLTLNFHNVCPSMSRVKLLKNVNDNVPVTHKVAPLEKEKKIDARQKFLGSKSKLGNRFQQMI